MNCPECGGDELIDVIYGYLPMDLAMKKDSGEFIWGGLFIPDDAHAYHCKKCGHEW